MGPVPFLHRYNAVYGGFYTWHHNFIYIFE